MLLRLTSQEENGPWLENVDRTHLVLASGKLVLYKNDLFEHLNSRVSSKLIRLTLTIDFHQFGLIDQHTLLESSKLCA